MNDIFQDISDEDLKRAKKRIWARMQSKLPDRGYSTYQPVVSGLRQLDSEVTRLQGVMLKERLLSSLPEREVPVSLAFPRVAFASLTLSVFLAVLFIPAFQGPSVMAARVNSLEVVQGEVAVNGTLAQGTTFLQEGDVLSTAEGALAHVHLMDDTRLTLAPNSEVYLDRLSWDPQNPASTQIEIDQTRGRVWTQVVSLVDSPSTFTVHFPKGKVSLNQRAAVDLQVSESSTELQVIQNLAELELQNYEGILTQGSHLLMNGRVILQEATLQEEDAWKTFNLAYGKNHLRQLEEKYRNEAIQRVVILPGNPLYVFKTFRENVQEAFAILPSVKEELKVQHAKNRLDEAQVLITDGDVQAAQAALESYKEKVAEVEDQSLVLLSEAEKNASFSGANVLTPSQKLRLVPELIEEDDLATASQYLEEYKAESQLLLTELNALELQEREAAVSTLLQEKMDDFHMIRLIASLSESTEVEADLLTELSMMVLSLRERSLDGLSTFFEETDYTLAEQQEVYTRLVESAELDPELSEQFKAVGEPEEVILPEEEPEDSVVDTRFLDFSHSNQSQDRTQSGD